MSRWFPFLRISCEWVTRAVDCHLLKLRVNLLCCGTSLLLRNKAEHDEDENWMRNFVFSFCLPIFDVVRAQGRRNHVSISIFCSVVLYLLSSFDMFSYLPRFILRKRFRSDFMVCLGNRLKITRTERSGKDVISLHFYFGFAWRKSK